MSGLGDCGAEGREEQDKDMKSCEVTGGQDSAPGAKD